jgi:hypothetical protein
MRLPNQPGAHGNDVQGSDSQGRLLLGLTHGGCPGRLARLHGAARGAVSLVPVVLPHQQHAPVVVQYDRRSRQLHPPRVVRCHGRQTG